MRIVFCLIMILPLASCAFSSSGSVKGAVTETYMASLEKNAGQEADKVFRRGDYKVAAGLYENLMQQNPDNSFYMLSYAEALRMHGESTKAVKYYDALLSKSSNNLKALEGKGLAYVQQGEFDKAVALFTKIINRDASKWRTVNALGVIHSLVGNIEEADQYYQMAIAISENNPNVLNNIGLSLAFNDDIEGAEQLLGRALRASPDGSYIKKKIDHNLALVYGLSGRVEQAEAILNRYLPEAAVYNNLGSYAKLANNPNLAKTYLSKSLTASPVHYTAAWQNLKSLNSLSSYEQ